MTVFDQIVKALTVAGLIAAYLEVFSGRGQELGSSIRGFLGGLGRGVATLGKGAGYGFYGFSTYTAKGVEAWLNIGRMLVERLPEPPEGATRYFTPVGGAQLLYDIATGRTGGEDRHNENMGVENRISSPDVGGISDRDYWSPRGF